MQCQTYFVETLQTYFVETLNKKNIFIANSCYPEYIVKFQKRMTSPAFLGF